MMRRLLIVLSFVFGFAGVSYAQTARFAMVVSGTSGGNEFAAKYRQWLDGLTKVLKEKGGLDETHLVVLTEQPGPGELKATADVVKAQLAALIEWVKPSDQLFIMLIGHGGGVAAEAKFNLVGPDLSAAEWNALLKPIKGHLVFVDATASSFGFLQSLAAPGRIVITATNSSAQQFDTVFADGFIRAFSSPAADADQNGRVSLWEAFVFASREAAQSYEQKGVLPTEHAVLDDSGDGVGKLATATGEDGSLAKMTYLDAPAVAHSADPAVQALIDQQQALIGKVDDLLRARKMMSAADFEQSFEKVITELALVSRDLRRHKF